MTRLLSQHCVPCQVGAPALPKKKARLLLKQIKQWKLVEHGKKIQKQFEFRDFKTAMRFVNQVAYVAEKQGHHPDIFVSWNKLTISTFTHKIGGLHQNDFILAAKIDQIQHKKSFTKQKEKSWPYGQGIRPGVE